MNNSEQQRATLEPSSHGCDKILRLEITDPNTVMSWHAYRKGFATVTMQGHKDAGWISIVVREVPEEKGVARAAYFTIAPDMVPALRSFIDQLELSKPRP